MMQNVAVVDENVTSQFFLEQLYSNKVVKFVEDELQYLIFVPKGDSIIFAERYPESSWKMYTATFPMVLFIFLYSLSDKLLAKHHIVAFTMMLVHMQDQHDSMYHKLAQYREFRSKKKASEYLEVDVSFL